MITTRHVVGTLLLAVASASARATAQTPVRAQPSAQATLDSATQARALYRAASQAASPGDAVPLLLRAARSWPTQPAYWIAVARSAARAADTAVVLEALNALASLHAGAAVLSDSALTRLITAPGVAAAMKQVARTTAPIPSGRVVATLHDSTVFAEGIDADPRTDALYVASVRHRTIYEISRAGRVRDLRLPRVANVGSILGVRVAKDGRTLYATMAGLPVGLGYAPADSAIAALVRIRIADGTIEARWDVPRDGARHLLGDLVVTNDGTVYTSDSNAPILYRLRVGASALEPIRHPLFRSLQGIACVPGCAQLIVADYSHGLLRVDAATHAVARIGDAPGTTSLGIDGIIWHGKGLIAVQNGIAPSRIARFVLDSTHTRVVRVDDVDRQPALADEPTIGTLWRGAFVYVANSQWEKFGDDGRRIPGTALRPTLVMRVPLPPR